MIPTYTTPVVQPKICLAFDWPTQMKIPKTAPDDNLLKDSKFGKSENAQFHPFQKYRRIPKFKNGDHMTLITPPLGIIYHSLDGTILWSTWVPNWNSNHSKVIEGTKTKFILGQILRLFGKHGTYTLGCWSSPRYYAWKHFHQIWQKSHKKQLKLDSWQHLWMLLAHQLFP